MVAVGERLMSVDLARDIVRAFLSTPFEGGRHERRVEKIDSLGDIQ
jgi:ribose 5-phosphate isomerase B